MNCTAHPLMAPIAAVEGWQRAAGEPVGIARWQVKHYRKVNASVQRWAYELAVDG